MVNWRPGKAKRSIQPLVRIVKSIKHYLIACLMPRQQLQPYCLFHLKQSSSCFGQTHMRLHLESFSNPVSRATAASVPNSLHRLQGGRPTSLYASPGNSHVQPPLPALHLRPFQHQATGLKKKVIKLLQTAENPRRVLQFSTYSSSACLIQCQPSFFCSQPLLTAAHRALAPAPTPWSLRKKNET